MVKMIMIEKIKYYRRLFKYNLKRNFKGTDKQFLEKIYYKRFKKHLDFNNPTTFNEKLNWLKLYYRKPEFTLMADKVEAKKIVHSIIGYSHVSKTIAVFNSVDELDFNKLIPPYVIKPTHTSGGVVVIRNKTDINEKKIKNKLRELMQRNYFYHSREWPYKNIQPRIIVEEYLVDHNTPNLPVYKFFCFSGEPFILQAIKNDKQKNETIDYFDMDWNRLDLKQNFENSEKPLEKPANFELMKDLARKLSGDLPFIRIDFYSVNGNIYFSEFTFFSDAGLKKFTPEKWDKILGDKIILPEPIISD